TKVLAQRIVPAPTAVAVELSLDASADVVELERLRSVDGEPNHVAHSFLPANRYGGAVDADFSEGSLYDFLRREYQADLATARIVVDVGTAAPDEAALLPV